MFVRVRAALMPGLLCLVWACGMGKNNEQEKKLDDIVARLDRIEKKVESGRIIRPPTPPQPQADPKTVYSVPVDGDPVRGPKVAKITIVEATDFA